MPWINLRKIMDQRNLSMRGFAKLLGVKPSVVTSYFRAGYDPRLSTVLRWCEALDCSMAEIIDGRTSGLRKHKRRPRSALAASNSTLDGESIPQGK